VLVFTRKRGEAIMIGDGIEIKVLRVGQDGVRLGVTAPADIAVHRQEIYESVRAANESAAAVPAGAARDVATRLRQRLAAGPPAASQG